MNWLSILVIITALGITLSAAYALYWASKTGQFKQLNKSATTIFDDEEPMGTVTDAFPGKKRIGASKDSQQPSNKQ